jgi:hypothetical protein
VHPFIWSRVSGLTRFCDVSDKRTASNFAQISERVWQKPWQWLDKCLGKKAWAIQGCLNGILDTEQMERGETGQEQSLEHAHHFLWHQDHSQWIRPDRPKSIPYTTVIFYSNCVKMWEGFAPNFGDKQNWLLHQDNAPSHTSFFTRAFPTKHDCCPPPPTPLLFPYLKTKLRGHHFDTIEVIEAEQNTTSRMHLKYDRSAGNSAYAQKGNTSGR